MCSPLVLYCFVRFIFFTIIEKKRQESSAAAGQGDNSSSNVPSQKTVHHINRYVLDQSCTHRLISLTYSNQDINLRISSSWWTFWKFVVLRITMFLRILDTVFFQFQMCFVPDSPNFCKNCARNVLKNY